jgi:hypothetical protein
MGPTLQQQFANAKAAYDDARARHKPSHELHRRMCMLRKRILDAEKRAERKLEKSK